MVNVKEIEKTYRSYFDFTGFKTPKGSLRINPTTGKITVLDNVYLWLTPPEGRLPVEFEMVNFSMQLIRRGLVTLAGCPKVVRQNFFCQSNQLTTLEGGPEKVGMEYNAADNPLQNLDGLASEIGGTLFIDYHRNLPLLRALVAPEVVFANYDSSEPPPRDIMREFRGTGREGAFECRRELRKAGFEGNARW